MNSTVKFFKSSRKKPRPWILDLFHEGKCTWSNCTWSNNFCTTHMSSSYEVCVSILKAMKILHQKSLLDFIQIYQKPMFFLTSWIHYFHDTCKHRKYLGQHWPMGQVKIVNFHCGEWEQNKENQLYSQVQV